MIVRVAAPFDITRVNLEQARSRRDRAEIAPRSRRADAPRARAQTDTRVMVTLAKHAAQPEPPRLRMQRIGGE